jgi:hypothetical protein
VTEPAERPPELRAEATDLAVGRPADDENAGTAARSHDTAAQFADDAVETVLSAADDIESLLETEPADSPPTAVRRQVRKKISTICSSRCRWNTKGVRR